MGLVSWIVDRHYNHKFHKANEFLLEGKTEQAVRILEKILDRCPDAPPALLSVYHSDICQGNNNKISDAALLYERHQSLKEECIHFANELQTRGQIQLHINYCQALYCKGGINELLSPFVASAAKLAIEDNSVNSLQILTKDNALLRALSESILIEAQKSYVQKELAKSERLCILIQPYLSSEEFYELYSDVRFDKIAKNRITEEAIKQLDKLFEDISAVYNLYIKMSSNNNSNCYYKFYCPLLYI